MSSGVDLNRLADDLRRHLAQAGSGMAVQVRDAGRLLTVLPAERSAAATADDGRKRSQRTPPQGAAFELYVALSETATDPSDQRILPPVQVGAEMTPEAGRTAQMWTLPAAGGGQVSVRLERGPDLTDDEARFMLDIVRQAVSSGTGPT